MFVCVSKYLILQLKQYMFHLFFTSSFFFACLLVDDSSLSRLTREKEREREREMKSKEKLGDMSCWYFASKDERSIL